MDSVLVDFRDAVRAVRRDPLYAVAVIATLGLTLGASTALSIVNGVLLRPLAYSDPQQLVSVREIVPNIAQQYPTLPVNGRHFEEWRTRASSFAAMAELEWRTTNLTGAGDPAQIAIVRASGTIFDVLQMPVSFGRPLVGRPTNVPERPPVTVISDRLWQDRLGRDPQVSGGGLLSAARSTRSWGCSPAASSCRSSTC